MACTLEELAQLVGGVCRGDPQLTVTGAAPLTTAVAGQITLVDAPERVRRLADHPAAAVVVPTDLTTEKPAIAVADVHAAFARIVRRFRPARSAPRAELSPRAVISPTARLAPNVAVHAGAIVGDAVEIGAGSTIYGGVHLMAGCKLGAGVTVFPNVVLYEDTLVGDRVILHAGVVLGAYGFGYRSGPEGHQQAAQLGYVEIGDDVEIGAGTTIDRGTYGPTRIGRGTKIDDQVMIGHNCSIGRHNLICGQVGIAGSTTTGDFVVLAGQVGLRDHIAIGDRAVIMAGAGVMHDVPDGEVWFGYPATPQREQKVRLISVANLPELRRRVKDLETSLAALVDPTAGVGGGRNAA